MSDPKVLILVAFFHPIRGGLETHAYQVARYLIRQGIKTMVLTKRIKYGGTYIPKFEIIDSIPIWRVPPCGNRTALQRWMMIPFAFFWMVRHRDKYDVVYCAGFRGNGLAAILAGKLLRKPIILKSGTAGILSCRNWDPYFFKMGLSPKSAPASFLKGLFRKFYSAAQGFICISNEMVEEAQMCKIDADRIHYLPEVVDCHKFRPSLPGERERIRSEEEWPQQAFLAIYVGRLSQEKGIIELISAWRLIEKEEAVLVVVGSDIPGHPMDVGPLARKLVGEYGLNGKVIFAGGREDIPRLLRAADCFIQPSHCEGFGLSVIEAMATGLAVVATNVGGMRDYLIDGVNGLFCDSLEGLDLVKPIHCLMENPQLRSQIGREARKTIENKFEESVVFEKLKQILLNCIDEPKHRLR